jgi:RNA 3'-phosphate cyclase
MLLIEIDGSEGEGGGQLLRCSVALSALTGREVRVFNIRAKRPKTGLAHQHLAAVRGVAALCEARVKGDSIGSRELVFSPGTIIGGRRRFDVGSAGSVSLVLQACILPALRSEKNTVLEITGGTNVRWSPPVDYYINVLFPILKRMGVEIHMRIDARGFYPEGGGKVTVEIEPAKELAPIDLSARGELRSLKGICFSQNLPEHVSKRISHSAKKSLLEEGDMRITSDVSNGASTGAGICLFAEYENTILGADALGERGVPAEKVGTAAAEALKKETSGVGTLDIHSSDQLIPFLVLTGSSSVFRIREMSAHLKTQMWLISRFLDARFEVKTISGGFEIVIP